MGRKTMIAGLALAALAPSVWASSVPNIMTYQGRLKESGSLVTGTRSVEIYLCDLPSGGSCYSASGPQNVSVVSGLFKSTFTLAGVVNLGNPPWFVDVRIGGTPLLPREQLTTTPYAFVSSTTLSVNAADVKPGTLGSGVILSAGQLGSGVLGTGIHFSGTVGIGTANPDPNYLIEARQSVNSWKGIALDNPNTGSNVYTMLRLFSGTPQFDFSVQSVPPAYATLPDFAGYGVLMTNNQGNGIIMHTKSTTGGIQFWVGDSDWRAGTEKMRVTSSGNVGIGTTQPAYKLDVTGNMRVTGQLDAGILGSGVTLAAGQLGSGVLGTGIHFADGVGIGAVPPPGVFVKISSSGANASTYVLKVATGTTDVLSVRGDGRVSFHSGMAPDYSANVMFGDWVHGDPNSVVGIGHPTGKVMTLATQEDAGSNIGTVSIKFGQYNLANMAEIQAVNEGGAPSNRTAGLSFWTEPPGTGQPVVERLRITGTGNVGIGTTQPAYKLDVTGNMRVTGQLDAGSLGSGITLSAGQLGSGTLVVQSTSTTGVNPFLKVLNNAGAEIMRIQQDGAVGIGKTDPSPSISLDIDGKGVQGLRVGNGKSLFYDGAWTDPHAGTSYDAKFGGAGRGIAVQGESIFNGNVGVGVTNPSYKLDVAGNMRVTGQLDVGVLGSGVLGSGVTVSPGNIGTGVLPAGVALQPGSVGTSIIAADAVTSAKILNGAVVDAKIFDVSPAKITGGVLGSGVILAAGNITAGTLGTSVLLGGYFNGAGVQVFNTNGTFNVPERVIKVLVEAWGPGGGGGGGGNGANAGCGGGGGAGGYAKALVGVTPGAAISVGVGSSGGAGSAGSGGSCGGTGGNGPNTNTGFGFTVSGGVGGPGGCVGGAAGGGGGSVVAGTPDVAVNGGNGGSALGGGSCQVAVGGVAGGGGGTGGISPGGGGMGGAADGGGGSGGLGRVIVWY